MTQAIVAVSPDDIFTVSGTRPKQIHPYSTVVACKHAGSVQTVLGVILKKKSLSGLRITKQSMSQAKNIEAESQMAECRCRITPCGALSTYRRHYV